MRKQVLGWKIGAIPKWSTLATLGLLCLETVALDAPLIGPIVGIVGVFILPGWLFTTILFGPWLQSEVFTWLTMVYASGAALVGLEVFVMHAFGLRIEQKSVALASGLISLLLLAILVARRRGLATSPSAWWLLRGLIFPSALIPVLSLAIGISEPLVEESYTEFYVNQPPERLTGNGPHRVDVVLVSHERNERTYTLECRDGGDTNRLIGVVTLQPGSTAVISLETPVFESTPHGKVMVELFVDKELTPYRVVELPGEGCGRLRWLTSLGNRLRQED